MPDGTAVSHQLRGLEERLGVELFRRDGRRLCITAAGEKLVELAQQVLLPLLQAELELRRGTFRERPKLRVSTQCYTAYHWLPGALQALRTNHPEVELVLQGDVVGDANEQLRDDHTDLVLCVIPPQKGAFQRVALFKALPDVVRDLRDVARSEQLFRLEQQENDAGN